jgi:methylated-DNA-[protein]-cysteine S-methyltransferase
VGRIGIAENGTAITDLFFSGEDITPKLLLRQESLAKEALLQETPLLLAAARQLNDYLKGRRRAFDLPLAPCGTAFQRAVWQALLDIPFGQTCSYGQIAAAVGSLKAARAVGLANNKNPIAIIIPCHRVIGADGRLVGYAGGLHIKEKLLTLEGCRLSL